MIKRIFLAGLLGCLTLMVWAFVANGFLGLTARIAMNRVADEPATYRVLKENVTAPGGYMVNPPLTEEGVFPPGEPAFGVRYGGVGHEAAGRGALLHLALAFVTATLAAALLSAASERVLRGFWRKVAFVAGIGLLMALACDVPEHGIGGYPMASALALAANRLLSWTAAGCAMAWLIGVPARGARA